MTLPSAEIIGEDLTRGGMHGHQPRLAELRAADGQHRGLEIDIVQLEIAGFAET